MRSQSQDNSIFDNCKNPKVVGVTALTLKLHLRGYAASVHIY